MSQTVDSVCCSRACSRAEQEPNASFDSCFTAWRVDVACSATTCGTLVRALRQLTPEGKQRGQPTHLHAIELSQLRYGAFLVWAG